jgi:hypothetical protein
MLLKEMVLMFTLAEIPGGVYLSIIILLSTYYIRRTDTLSMAMSLKY